MTDQLYRTAGLRSRGYTYDDIRQMLRGGRLAPVRRGTYLAGSPPDEAMARHRLAVRAAALQLGPDSVISHVSAAALHRLPTWSIPLKRVHITRSRNYGGRRLPWAHVHVAALRPSEITAVDGIQVTSVPRTVVDIARSVPFEQAVVVADAALAAGLTGPDELAAAARALSGRRGMPAARQVVAFADGRSESVGESRSRVALARAGLPPPVLQWEVRDSFGRLIGRVDFGWPEHRVVAEFDGRVKYGRALSPGQSAADAVYQEKRREDALRADALAVVRWGWEDLEKFEAVDGPAPRLRRLLPSASHP